MVLVDSHCHLHLMELAPKDSLAQVIERARVNDVLYLLNVCVSLSDFKALMELVDAFPGLGASVGMHPNEKGAFDLDALLQCAKHPKVIAVGETGLDYYRSTGDLSWQRERFRLHIAAAKQLALPLIIHTRAAKADTLQIMAEERVEEIGGVMHCFSEDWETAKQALDRGFYISFAGVVTFKNAASLQAVAKRVPKDRLLIETDSPYLAPVPCRGKQNEPAYVRHTAAFLADLRGESLESLAEATTQNFFTLFKGAIPAHV